MKMQKLGVCRLRCSPGQWWWAVPASPWCWRGAEGDSAPRQSGTMKWGELPCLVWVTFSTSDIFLLFPPHSLALPSFSSSPLAAFANSPSATGAGHPVLPCSWAQAQPVQSCNGWWRSSPDFLLVRTAAWLLPSLLLFLPWSQHHRNSGIFLAFRSPSPVTWLCNCIIQQQPCEAFCGGSERAQQCRGQNHTALQHQHLFFRVAVLIGAGAAVRVQSVRNRAQVGGKESAFYSDFLSFPIGRFITADYSNTITRAAAVCTE